MMDTVIKFQNASIVFGENPHTALPLMDAGKSREEIRAETGQILGVHDCSFDVQEGEIVVLMGLSGSGKSTLLRASNRLNTLAHGSVQLRRNGQLVDLSQVSAEELREIRRHDVSMVFQQFGLLPWRSVLENTAFGLEAAGVPKEQRLQKAMAQLEKVHLGQWANTKISELSGGMQQRVGLARAFATDAPLLLMDEPFSALDPLIRNELQNELLDLQADLNRTILFVSHDLDEAIKLGSRIAIMEGGRIVQLGTPQEIVLRPATDYVKNFVAHMNPINVLHAAEIMQPVKGEVPGDARVHRADTTVKDLMRAQLNDAGECFVSDGHEIIGKLDHSDIFKALLRE
ncbi:MULTISPECIES: choline ABC transporter ATP-binding protein [unclassified Aliiroseovarius]|uniref:choline ABC transporter ATP-binding protein n=1 Tax=unclassified Aliiroseovarius TaxID=2623558 RepID=UPI0019F46D20|nr:MULTISPECIES: choline ABC transporter ATP-binding protein [unclassified Aliiroseovarius]NRP13216.1 Glycine betaine/proline betaine transport system ATP-binding protein ProV [Aliiroseovarius sp. xm-d-517]NRP30238.1 Glycine betaine/proline betaine transport system ATP-binding protein ProV [Aliiroseovarius sp. xm-m-314]NRP40309.1 Glycine betaine/proline betaine transport system ATP-binding protein ProV [Aliiroseovarius sp. xm-m-339-2]NRP43050.1 Glycine betaine/proline betaine transport system A